MKSIKPGRGPSMMSGAVGIFMICFGILWTIFASQARPIFALFGILWTGVAVVQTIYHFKNATGKKRYSAYDITDSSEEPDPLNERFGRSSGVQPDIPGTEGEYCPYCGTKVDADYHFCNKCGRELPL
ncbi:MAG: zinc ribbon domain-containing protein [Clostridiales bacterium]|nr:zinc ribbon domain-containing protein [Clostridiales bacterium]